MAVIAKYALDHWRGRQSLLWSFLVNGIAFYILMVVLVLSLNAAVPMSSSTNALAFYSTITLFLAGLVWSFVGIARASWVTLRDPNAALLKKGFAVVLVGLLIIATVTAMSDFLRLV